MDTAQYHVPSDYDPAHFVDAVANIFAKRAGALLQSCVLLVAFSPVGNQNPVQRC